MPHLFIKLIKQVYDDCFLSYALRWEAVVGMRTQLSDVDILYV